MQLKWFYMHIKWSSQREIPFTFYRSAIANQNIFNEMPVRRVHMWRWKFDVIGGSDDVEKTGFLLNGYEWRAHCGRWKFHIFILQSNFADEEKPREKRSINIKASGTLLKVEIAFMHFCLGHFHNLSVFNGRFYGVIIAWQIKKLFLTDWTDYVK